MKRRCAPSTGTGLLRRNTEPVHPAFGGRRASRPQYPLRWSIGLLNPAGPDFRCSHASYVSDTGISWCWRLSWDELWRLAVFASCLQLNTTSHSFNKAVSNPNGSRPVDLVARSIMGQLRSAAQSASRNREAMFGDNGPVWGFISRIGPSQYAGRTTDLAENRAFVNFEAARDAADQTHLIEVYPALALPALEPAFMVRAEAARYNPGRPNFSLDDWGLVCGTVALWGNQLDLQALAEWAGEMVQPWDALEGPVKRDQDKIDAALCLIIALQWRHHPAIVRVIGNLETGYIVVPTSVETRDILKAACNERGVNLG